MNMQDKAEFGAIVLPNADAGNTTALGRVGAGRYLSIAERLENEAPSSNVPARLGLWIDTGFQIYYSKFKLLVLLAAIGVGLGIVTFGFAVPVLAAVMAVVVLREMEASVPNLSLKVTPWICVHGLLIMVIQNILAYGGSYLLEKIPYVNGFALTAWSIAIESLFAFALLFVVAFELTAPSAIYRSVTLASKAGISLLWLYVMGAAASKLGGAFFGFGAIVTAPILVCLLASAFVSLTADERLHEESSTGSMPI
jgi:hypothetical protein